MTVYFAFIPSRRLDTADDIPLEFAPNQAVPEWALKQRARHQTGPTFYDGVTAAPVVMPTADFPGADLSARLLVWKRSPTQAVPQRHETPDEVWTLTPRGRVVKSAWTAADSATPSHPRHKETRP
ncbi:hypothetical protein SMD44_p10034 (plasmid) [Streptomyces alboflavus]|uniref:Uncharacterized protein n=1 Tax=Streptomyces alboflavus TaxID=67267 RepID=A0A291W3R1_9ACTN|nr:hypothetical protein [Streptomyces alboflavus]ATM24533.1 hypothetical protein SMD44_p10034 [Streptomyces alboflavus]